MAAVASLALLLATSLCGAEAPSGPSTLIWTYMDFDYLRDNAQTFKARGIDGFIFCYVSGKGVPRWNSGPEKVRGIYAEVAEVNRACRAAGIEDNFVHAGIDDAAFDWLAPGTAALVVATFRELARIGRSTGCRGVAIDAENYSTGLKLWDPTAYPPERRAELRERIFQTGQQVREAILDEWPDAEVFVLPNGSYFWKQRRPQLNRDYQLWIAFWDGLASADLGRGMLLGVENTYEIRDAKGIQGFYDATDQDMAEQSLFPEYWQERCQQALGAWSLDKGKDEGLARCSPEQFREQIGKFRKLCPRYIWIFGAESGWFTLDGQKYPHATPSMSVPLADDAGTFFDILRGE